MFSRTDMKNSRWLARSDWVGESILFRRADFLFRSETKDRHRYYRCRSFSFTARNYSKHTLHTILFRLPLLGSGSGTLGSRRVRLSWHWPGCLPARDPIMRTISIYRSSYPKKIFRIQKDPRIRIHIHRTQTSTPINQGQL